MTNSKKNVLYIIGLKFIFTQKHTSYFKNTTFIQGVFTMHNLQHEILHTLQKNKSNKDIINKISKYKNILIKNHSNPIFNNEDKNKILNIYNKLQNVSESLYRYNMLKSYNIDAQEEKEHLENIVLKGAISNVRYIWHSEHGEHTCNECLELDGKEFNTFDEVPERPHPNCKCSIEIIEEDKHKQNKDISNRNNQTKINSSKFIMPCNCQITSFYDYRIHPIYKTSKMHNGWDIATPIGTPIKAIASGRVYYAGDATGYGKMIVIIHDINGTIITSEYGHILSYEVHSGQYVKQGDVIAKSGNEGTSSGPHLHLTIRKGPYRGVAIDPGIYIKY